MSSLGLRRGTVSLSPYQDDWPMLFAVEKRRLLQSFDGKPLEIEHIGSTAVPGLAAKPLLDMLLAIESLDSYPLYIGPLKELGYEFTVERVFSDRIFLPKGPTSGRTHHLNLVIKNSPQWVDSLLFRDYLRNHPDTRQAYQVLKKRLAIDYATNRERYTAMKYEFITGVIMKAHQNN